MKNGLELNTQSDLFLTKMYKKVKPQVFMQVFLAQLIMLCLKYSPFLTYGSYVLQVMNIKKT